MDLEAMRKLNDGLGYWLNILSKCKYKWLVYGITYLMNKDNIYAHISIHRIFIAKCLLLSNLV